MAPDDPGTPGATLVLASASPARAALLRNAGVEPTIVVSTVDEQAVTAASRTRTQRDPRALTQLLAWAKARDVVARVADGGTPGLPGGRDVLVVGADSMLVHAGRVLGKAGSAQEVRRRWAAMAGTEGVLMTGHAVVHVASGRTAEAVVATTVRFGSPDPQELEAYIASGEPLGVAGSCTIDGLGGPFIDGIDGDHTNVIGLALPTLRRLLADLGVRWTDLWKPPLSRSS